jgi:hypothetical protein
LVSCSRRRFLVDAKTRASLQHGDESVLEKSSLVKDL